MEINLPDLLVSTNGTPIQTLQDWEDIRRPELLEIFYRNYFGYTPTNTPAPIVWEVVEEKAGVDVGATTLVTRRQVAIYIAGRKGRPQIDVLIYIPENRPRPCPVILALNYNGNQTVSTDPGVLLSDGISWNRTTSAFVRMSSYARSSSSRLPIYLLINEGYAVMTSSYNDTATDYDPNYKYTAHRMWWEPNQNARTEYEWGHIGLWAWQMSRIIDYVEADEDLDVNRVAAQGHSRLGSATEWAGAQDRRIKVPVVSGAGPLERDPLLAQDLNDAGWTWSWVTPHQTNFIGMAHTNYPWDMHMLAALALPNHFYCSASENEPYGSSRGEFMTVYYASAVAEQLFGLTGMSSYTNWPNTIPTYVHNDLAYDRHAGTHTYGYTEWVHWIDYFDMKVGKDASFTKPASPAVDLVNDGAPVLTWTGVSGATGYEIQRRVAAGTPQAITLDNTASGVTYTGGYYPNAYADSLLNAYGGSQLLHLAPAVGKTDYVRYTPNFAGDTGVYEVRLWWGRKNCPRNQPLKIVASGVTNSITLNMQLGEGGWVSLGEYNFQQGDYVEFSAGFNPEPAGQTLYSVADCVQFYRENGSSDWLTVGNTDSLDTVFVDESAAAATAYEYRVRALKTSAGQTSAWTDVLPVTTVNGGSGLPAVPQMVLKRSLVTIDDDGTDTVTNSTATIPVSLTYSVYNYGASNLVLTLPLQITSTQNCTVALGTAPSTVASLQNSNLVVSITPVMTGTWTAVFALLSNDTNTSPYAWTVSGSAAIPPIDLDPPSAFLASATNASSVSLVWSNEAASGDGYVIERRSITAANPVEIILDTEDPGVVNFNFWWDYWSAGMYGSSSYQAYAVDETVHRTVTFTPDLSGQDGSFEVFLWYSTGADCQNVPVVVTENGVTNTIIVDQTQNRAQWYSIGTFDMVNSDHVQYTSDFTPVPAGSSQQVMADAVRFYRAVGGSAWEQAALISGTGTVSFLDTTVAADTLYEYRIAATSQYGAGDWSASLQVAVPAAQAVDFTQWAGTISWGAATNLYNADPDADGYDNLVEYALAGNPLVPASSRLLELGRMQVSNQNYAILNFRRRLGMSDTELRVYSRTNLFDAGWTLIKTIPAGSSAVTNSDLNELSVDQDAQTLRLRVPVDLNLYFFRMDIEMSQP